MVSPHLALYLACLIAGQAAAARESPSVQQGVDFVSAEVGDALSLPCFFVGEDLAWLYWYKQTLGERPQMISSFYKFNGKQTFYEEFQDGRFSLEPGSDKLDLKISDVRILDSGTYFCASSNHYQLEFARGVFVDINGSNVDVRAWVHQSVMASNQPGSSESLECTVHAGSCNGEHMVYWFRNAEESNPGVIYAHGGKSDRCKSDSETQTRTCVLPLTGLNHSNAGTYYCALAACGHILFGNGTKLDFRSEEHHLILVFVLSGALAITTILSVLLFFSICKMQKQISCNCTGSQLRFVAPSAAETEGNEEAAELHYAALNADAARASRREASQTKTECVYSRVRHHK